jgi:ABC-type transport system substrate-binding protein
MSALKSLLRIFLIMLLTLSSSIFCPPATAEIRQFHEKPGTLLYKSQWTLKDQTSKSWQAIAFQVRTPQPSSFTIQLRLVGFPGSITLDPTQPLRLDDRQQFLTASSNADNLPSGAVGQFDIQPILRQLDAKKPLYLTLTGEGEATVELKVPPFLVEEWQSLPDRVD